MVGAILRALRHRERSRPRVQRYLDDPKLNVDRAAVTIELSDVRPAQVHPVKVEVVKPTWAVLPPWTSATGGHLLKDFDAVRNRPADESQTLHRAAGFARQTKHEGLADHGAKPPRQDGVGCEGQ